METKGMQKRRTHTIPSSLDKDEIKKISEFLNIVTEILKEIRNSLAWRQFIQCASLPSSISFFYTMQFGTFLPSSSTKYFFWSTPVAIWLLSPRTFRARMRWWVLTCYGILESSYLVKF